MLSEPRLRRFRAGLSRLRLTMDRAGSPSPRVIATACWQFPIHSQTFVYEELEQLIRAGFGVRFLFNEQAPRTELGGRFDALWARRWNARMHPDDAGLDLAWFRRRQPDRVGSILKQLSDAAGMSVHDLERHEHVTMAFSYARVALASRPHYLHSYFFYEGSLFSLVAAQLLDVPRGVSCYADHMLQDYALKVVPLHLGTCDIVVATSERIRRELLAMHPDRRRDNILVKPNGIDVARFPEISRLGPARGEPLRIVMVCRLEPKKGLLEMIDAARLLVTRGTNVLVRVIGSEDRHSAASREYAERVRSRIGELGLTAVVRLEGRRGHGDVLRFLHDAHVFVAPFVELESGDKDGIPTALLEAMSTGLPVVATDAGSIAEVIDHGRTGLLVRQGDPVALAEGIGQLAARVDLRRTLGEAAARLVRDRFDASRAEQELHRRIRNVLARPAR